TGAAVRANALLRLQKPDALLVKKVLAAQGADRTDVDHVARQLVVARFTWKHVDFGVCATVDDQQFPGAADLAGEAHAPAAHDGAVGEKSDVVADVILVGLDELFVLHPTVRASELVAVVLKEALAGLIADRTIERMIE